MPKDCSRGVSTFLKIVNKSSKKNIPAGKRKEFVPFMPREAKVLCSERDEIRSNDASDPRIIELNREIDRNVSLYRSAKWKERVEAQDPRSNSGGFWNLLKQISGKAHRPPPNQPIKFKGKTKIRHRDIADAFNRQYTMIRTHKSDKKTRKVV